MRCRLHLTSLLVPASSPAFPVGTKSGLLTLAVPTPPRIPSLPSGRHSRALLGPPLARVGRHPPRAPRRRPRAAAGRARGAHRGAGARGAGDAGRPGGQQQRGTDARGMGQGARSRLPLGVPLFSFVCWGREAALRMARPPRGVGQFGTFSLREGAPSSRGSLAVGRLACLLNRLTLSPAVHSPASAHTSTSPFSPHSPL